MFRTTLILQCVAFASISQAIATASTFSHSFNLLDDYTEYLVSTTNVEMHRERVAGTAMFWWATPINTWGEVVYRFPLLFAIESATLDARIAAFSGGGGEPNFDPLAEAHLDVSTDGNDWVNVGSRTPGNGGYWSGPGDITPLVAGADTVYVRARLFSTRNWPVDGPIFAQFLRTSTRDAPVSEGGPTVFRFQAVGVPEPGTLGLVVSLIVSTTAVRRARLTRAPRSRP